MFWVGLATLIMIISGGGDDSRAARKRWHAMEQAIIDLVSDRARAERAIDTVHDVERLFTEHRARLEKTGACIENADRKYDATEADYMACEPDLLEGWQLTTNNIIDAEASIRTALTEDEFNAMYIQVNGKNR